MTCFSAAVFLLLRLAAGKSHRDLAFGSSHIMNQTPSRAVLSEMEADASGGVDQAIPRTLPLQQELVAAQDAQHSLSTSVEPSTTDATPAPSGHPEDDARDTEEDTGPSESEPLARVEYPLPVPNTLYWHHQAATRDGGMLVRAARLAVWFARTFSYALGYRLRMTVSARAEFMLHTTVKLCLAC